MTVADASRSMAKQVFWGVPTRLVEQAQEVVVGMCQLTFLKVMTSFVDEFMSRTYIFCIAIVALCRRPALCAGYVEFDSVRLYLTLKDVKVVCGARVASTHGLRTSANRCQLTRLLRRLRSGAVRD